MSIELIDPPRKADPKYLDRVLRIMHPPDSTIELRSFGVDGRPKKTVAGYFRDFGKAAEAAVALERRNPSAIYLVMNQVQPDLYGRSPDLLTDFPEHATSDKDIIRRHWLLVDIDPERPAGISSTDEELRSAENLAADLRDWLTEQMGWHEPGEGMSGNGWHNLYPVNLPNDEPTAAMLKRILEALQAKALEISPDGPTCKVDLKVFNASRITKFYGTMTRKGHDTPERPHRRSYLHYVPETLGDWANRPAIALDLLQAVANLAPAEKPQREPETNGFHGERKLRVGLYLQDAGVDFRQEPAKGGEMFIINPCPFNPDHKGKDAAIFQGDDGKLTFHCFHDGCQGKTWHDVKSLYGQPKNHHWDPPKPDFKKQHRECNQQQESPDEAVEIFKPISIWDLAEIYPNLKPPVIDGLLRQVETMGIHAKSKVGKSWTAYGLALSVASGRSWLDRFPCKAGNVLLIDNELHPENLASRIPRTVANAMNLSQACCRGTMDVIHLRGRLRDIYSLRGQFKAIPHGHYSLIIIDALYRILPPGISENDNAEMAMMFNVIDEYAQMTGAAIVFIHHTSKGSQSEKDVTDVGSGAGSISRAVDTHLVLRPHEEPDHVVLEAAVRSFAPVEPVVLRWGFPLWQPADDMDPGALKGRKTSGEQRQEDRDREGIQVLVDILRKWDKDKDGPATPNAITDAGPYGREKTRNLLGKMLHCGNVSRKPITVRGNETHEYSLTD